MRQLTDSEKKIVEKGWLYHLGNRRPRNVDYDFYEAGFLSALDHSAAQIAALTADNARLRTAVAKLLAYVAGEVPLSEVEGIVAEMRRVADNPTN